MSTTFGRTITIKGEIRTSEDVTIEGRMDGPIFGDRSVVVVAASAQVAGDIIADDITVYGRVAGQLVATDIVDVRAGATVHGQVMSKRFILDPEATFTGRVEPQHLEAALSVARFNQKKRDAAAGG
jgi:cytoskeletal protein CcmA (bactofilin family)